MALDMTTPMGRDVPTAQQVLEVVRGSLRLALVFGEAVRESIRNGQLQGTPDLELEDGNDDGAETAVFNALVADGLKNVKEWAHDMGMVFDQARVTTFIANAVREAYTGSIAWTDIEY